MAGLAWTTATRFFDLPLEDKLSVARPGPDYPYGYIPLAGESLSKSVSGAAPPDLKEVFNAGPPARPSQPFAGPGKAWAYSPACGPRRCRNSGSRGRPTTTPCGTSATPMSLFARGLGLPPGFFAGQTGQAANALRAIDYPARTRPASRAAPGGHHTDYGTLTILRQDAVGGLEVLDLGGRWVGVEPVPGAFVINIGDLMARWTNERWRSTLHRVVDPPDPAAAAARRQACRTSRTPTGPRRSPACPPAWNPARSPARAGARRAASDGQVPPVGQLVTWTSLIEIRTNSYSLATPSGATATAAIR